MDTTDPPGRTLYSAYELDFMLSLRPGPAADITREQIGVPSVPEEARPFVTAAVTAGLQARGKVVHGDEDQWQLGEEAQVIATALTGADRWLGFALSKGEAMRTAFVVKTGQAVVMLVQDELDTYAVSAIDTVADVPRAVASIASSFLHDAPGRTVSLRRTDAADPARVAPLMVHGDDDGIWHLAHEPADSDGVLAVSPVQPDRVEAVITRLWTDGLSGPDAD